MNFKRTYLLILLIPLGAFWCWIIFCAPIFGWNKLESLEDGTGFYLSHQHGQLHEYAVFDIEKQQCRFAKDQATGFQLGISSLRHHVSAVKTAESQHRLQIDILGESNPVAMRAIELSIPLDGIVRVIANRYVVAEHGQSIRWLDLQAPGEKWSELQVPGGVGNCLRAHHQLPVFSRFPLKPSTAAVVVNPPRPQCDIELYRFDEIGELKLLGSWPTSISGLDADRSASFQEETIASLNLNGKHLEFRSLDNGELVETVELNPPVDWSKQDSFFESDKLIVNEGTKFRYYSLKHRKWLVPPIDVVDSDWTRVAADLSPDSSLALWHGRVESGAVITDTLTDEVVCKLDEPGTRYTFLDDHTLVSTDPWFGLTIRQYDLTTGKTVLTWRPFWWFAPLLGLTLICSMLWINSWLQLGRPHIDWIWFNLHGLLLLFMVLVSMRLTAIGNPVDTSRLPYQHAIYLTTGFLFAAWGWFVLGTGSILSRLSHLLIVYVVVFGSLTHNLSAQPRLAWLGAAMVTLPCLMALPAFLVARIFGVRWSTAMGKQQPEESGSVRTEIVTLRQILFVTMVIAVLSLMVRPIINNISSVPLSNWPIREPAVIAFIGLAAAYLATTKRRWLVRFGFVATFFMLLALCLEALLLASYDGWWRPQEWLSFEARMGLGQFCTVFAVATSLQPSRSRRQRTTQTKLNMTEK